MTYRLDPDRPLVDEVRRAALECLDDAIERLREIDGDADQVLEAVDFEARQHGRSSGHEHACSSVERYPARPVGTDRRRLPRPHARRNRD